MQRQEAPSTGSAFWIFRVSSRATCCPCNSGDFGADVIKIEPPAGDPLRAWQENGKQLFWKTYGRNKRSAKMNLRQPAAMDALMRMVEGADVFIENYRPGTLEKMGIGPDVLLARNPNLIIVRVPASARPAPIPAFPASAPWSRR